MARLSLVALGAATSGCIWTSDGGFTERYVSDWEGSAHTAPGSWDGEPISIRSRGGRVVVVGVPGKDHISVTANFSAGARNQADAEAAFVDVHESLSIELEDGEWSVRCNRAAETHGSAVPSSTGCDRMVVEVPAGDVDRPVSLLARTRFGGIHASGLVVDELDIEAPFGLVADVEPVDGARLRLWGNALVSGMCSSRLRVPADTGFESIRLDVGKPRVEGRDVIPDDPEDWRNVELYGFEDAPPLEPRQSELEWARDGDRILVEDAVVHASLGKAVLTTHEVPRADALTLCSAMEMDLGWSGQ